jgi:hypothetical protein
VDKNSKINKYYLEKGKICKKILVNVEIQGVSGSSNILDLNDEENLLIK